MVHSDDTSSARRLRRISWTGARPARLLSLAIFIGAAAAIFAVHSGHVTRSAKTTTRSNSDTGVTIVGESGPPPEAPPMYTSTSRPGYECLPGWPELSVADVTLPAKVPAVTASVVIGSASYPVGPIAPADIEWFTGAPSSATVSLDTGVTRAGSNVDYVEADALPWAFSPGTSFDGKSAVVAGNVDSQGEFVASRVFLGSAASFVASEFQWDGLPYTGDPSSAIANCVPISWWPSNYPNDFPRPGTAATFPPTTTTSPTSG